MTDEIDSLWSDCELWVGRAIKVSGGAGTFVTLLYFIKIQYLPLEGITGIAGLAAAVALVSLGLLFALTTMWGTPTLVFRAGAQAWPAVVLPLFLHSPGHLNPSEKRTVAPSPAKTLGWTAATVGIPWAGIFLLAWLRDRPEWYGGNTAAFIAFGAWAAAVWHLTSATAQRNGEDPAAKPNSAARLQLKRFAFAAGYSLSGSYALVALWTLATRSYVVLGHDPQQRWIFVLFLGVSVLMGTFVNAVTIAVALKGEGIAKVATAAQSGVVLISLVFGATAMGVWADIHHRVMILASVRVPNSSIVLSEAGCRSLEIQGVRLPSADPAHARYANRPTPKVPAH